MKRITLLLAKIIQEKSQTEINKETIEELFAFRKNSGTKQTIVCLKSGQTNMQKLKTYSYLCILY